MGFKATNFLIVRYKQGAIRYVKFPHKDEHSQLSDKAIKSTSSFPTTLLHEAELYSNI